MGGGGDSGGGRPAGGERTPPPRGGGGGGAPPAATARVRHDVGAKEGPAVRDRGVGGRQLQWRDRKTLPEADRAEVHRIPLRERTDAAGRLGGKIHSRGRAESEGF